MHELGDVVTLKYDAVLAGTLITPSAVTCTITLPDGTTTSPTPEVDEIGHYRTPFTTTQAGRHTVRWTGAGAPGKSDVFMVRESVPLALCSLDDMRAHLNMTERADDAELRLYLEAATLAVERHRGEIVARRSFTDRPTLCAPRHRIALASHPVLSLTSIERTDGSQTWDVGDWSLDGSTGLLSRLDGDALLGEVDIVYVAGYRVVPESFVLASAIIAAHLWETQRNTSFASGPAFGGEDILTPSGIGYAVPHRAVELLGGTPPVFA